MKVSRRFLSIVKKQNKQFNRLLIEMGVAGEGYRIRNGFEIPLNNGDFVVIRSGAIYCCTADATRIPDGTAYFVNKFKNAVADGLISKR